MRLRKLFCWLALAIAFGSFAIGPAHAKKAHFSEPGDPIPRHYDTWSLFLVCNPAWIAEDQFAKDHLAILKDGFLGFGRSIGSKNVAVWLSIRNDPDGYDAERAADYCKTYGLEANKSPYVVVSSHYPDGAKTGAFTAISLAGLDEENMLYLLGQISDQIRQQKLDAVKVNSDRYWRGWVQVLHDSADAARIVLKSFTFSVDARAVKVTFDGEKLVNK